MVETDYAQLGVSSFPWSGYECPSWNKEGNGNLHAPECEKGKRDNLLENEVVWFHLIDKVFADGPDSFSLLRARLLDTSDEDVADNNIFCWVFWDTAPGGKISSFDIDEDRLPVDYFIKGIGNVCLDDETPLFKSINNGRDNSAWVIVPY